MTFPLARIKSLLLAFCAATALMAQVDSKLLTTTDLLDVYKSGGGMPEMLTIFDMSGSMVNAFWHANYWTDQNSDSGNEMDINTTTGVVSMDIGNSITATGFLVEPSGTRITTLPITAAVVKRASHARLTATVTGSVPTGSTTYTYRISSASWSNNNKRTTYTTTTAHGLSVGDIVVITGVTPAAYNGTFTVTRVNSSTTFGVSAPTNPTSYVSGGTATVQRVVYVSGTYTRTLDIPVPWTILRVPSTLPTLPSAGTAPVPDFAVDPQSGSSVEYDTYYSLANANVLPSTGSSVKIGFFTYNPDYIYWLFWGNVVKAADGNSFNTTPPGGYKDDRNQAPAGGVFAAGASTFSGSPYGGTYPAGGGFIIPGVYDPAYGSASTPSTTVWSNNQGTTFNNGIPVGTRSMFLKKAVLATWFAKQDKVLWAYRFLDTSSAESSTPSSTNFGTGNRYLTRLKTVASGIDASVTTIQQKFPGSSTPLTSALANAYAQLINSGSSASTGNPGSVFDKVNAGIDPSPCRASFVIMFTDGIANTDTIGPNEVNLTTTPPTGVLSESVLQAIPFSYLDESAGKNFNIWSLAAVAAHGLDNGTANANQKTTGTGSPSAYAPFRIMNRGAEGSSGRKITTMTVGLSLAGSNTTGFDAGGKGPLLRTALYGDPANTNTSSYTAKFDLLNSVAYGKTPKATTGIATNFFDASDPDALISSLSAIIARITQANTSITAPAAPLVGLNLGNRAYLGRFASTNAGTGSGSVWQGDLLMTGLGINPLDGTVGLKDRSGEFQVDINVGNAVASASAALSDSTRGWKGRNIYTAIPGTAIPSGGLPLTATAQAFTDSNTLLTAKVMGVATSAEAGALIRFIRGASLEAQIDSSKATSRSDMMGDIVNSSPAAVEYSPTLIPSNSRLSGLWGSTYSGMTDARFQVIFVGDNQGHFHAFGEVSGLDANGILQADLDELWSFVPTELLNSPSVSATIPKLSLLKTAGVDHIYTVDGSPYIYFKDTPLTGAAFGNRRVDSYDTIRVIVGMRKGGRSYYAFDVVDPGAPKLAWMLDPNNSSDTAIQAMGLATSTPSVARVETGATSIVKDVVFIGGGYSNNALDAQIIGNNTVAAKLGRSLLALDVLDGTVIKAYNFNAGTLATNFPNMGAIAAGAFPLEFYVGSKKAQRVYFGDQSGGVYALGSMETLTTAPVGWRLDNSNIDRWTTDGSLNVSTTPATAGIRWIYKGATTTTGSGATLKVSAASPISSTPVAYRVPKAIPQFQRPSTSSNAPNMTPPVVGVTFGTGDRNDPMDLDPIGPVSGASFRQVMVFDRQDSADLPTSGGLPSNVNAMGNAITDAQLADRTSNTTPGDTSYLGSNQYLGYYLRFHGSITDPLSNKALYEKSYLNSVVTNGGLVFSTFRPGNTASSVVCQGAGTTYTFRLCDALAPVFGSGDLAATGTTDKQLTGCNGWVFAWTNLAGDLTSIGSRMVIQSGQDSPVAGTPTSSNVKIQDLVVHGGTTAFAPRAWRIIR